MNNAPVQTCRQYHARPPAPCLTDNFTQHSSRAMPYECPNRWILCLALRCATSDARTGSDATGGAAAALNFFERRIRPLPRRALLQVPQLTQGHGSRGKPNAHAGTRQLVLPVRKLVGLGLERNAARPVAVALERAGIGNPPVVPPAAGVIH